MAATFVQGTGVQSTGSVASLAKAFASNLGANSLVVASGVGNAETGLTTTSVTDSKSNSYTRDVNLADPGTPTTQCAIYSAQNSTSGACTVTLDPTGSDTVSLGIAEFSGMATSSPVSTTATGNGNSGSPVTGNLVTSGNTAIVAIVSHAGATNTLTPGGTYTQIAEDEDATEMPFNNFYKIVGAGTYTADASIGATVKWVIVAVAYKEAPAGKAMTIPQRSWRRWARRLWSLPLAA